MRGKVTITLGAVRHARDFDVTLRLEGVVVRHPNGALENIPDASFPAAKIGWLPG